MLNKCKIVLCLQTFDSMFLQNRSFKITHEQKNIRKMHKWFCDQLLWKGAGSNPYQDLLLYLTKCSKANLKVIMKRVIDFPTFLKKVTIQPQFVDISPEITCDDDVRSWGDDRFWSVPVARRPLPARWSPRLLHINNLPLDHYSLSNTQPLYLHPNPNPNPAPH